MSATEVTLPNTPPAAPVTVPPRPDNVPEKFWDAEKGAVRTDDLLKSYSELEKGRGAPAAPAPSTTLDASPDAAAQAATDAAGVPMAALEAEFSETGALSDGSYAKLQAAGFDKATVDEFIAYRQSKGDALQAEVATAAGGEQALDAMIAWAGKGYSPEQAEAFNAAVVSGDKGRLMQAVKALKADYTAANPARPQLLQPTTAPNAGAGDRFESMAELLAAQADPRYFKDAAYRQGVEKKLQRSNIV